VSGYQLLRRLHARNDVAQIDLHGLALVGGRKNSTFSSSRSSDAKKASSCCFRRRRGFFRHGERPVGALLNFEPFVSDDHHGLRQIKRGEGRIDRQSDDAIGERDSWFSSPLRSRPKQDGDGFAGVDARRRERRRFRRPDHGFRLVVGAGVAARPGCNRRSRLRAYRRGCAVEHAIRRRPPSSLLCH